MINFALIFEKEIEIKLILSPEKSGFFINNYKRGIIWNF